MTDPKTPDRGRRRLLGTSGAALAMAAAAGTARAANTYTITRWRFQIAADTYLPQAGQTYVLPFSSTTYSDNSDCTLKSDNTIKVKKAGLYRVVLSCDWPGQYNVDIDLRTYGSRLKAAGTAAMVVSPHDLTPTQDTDTHLATVDIPGSDPPQMARYQGAWTPGTIAMGAVVSTDVTLPTTGIVMGGDVVMASHTSVTDKVIGVAGTTALIITAKVVGADKVRVSMYNPTVAGGITVPAGTLQVVAMSAVNTRGCSADAWTILQSTTQSFSAGDSIYGVFASKTQGDFLQASDSTFLQIERWE